MSDKFIDVSTGEVSVSSRPVILRVLVIGSCVAVVAYDWNKKIGGLAHIMLPGRAPNRVSENRTKYAEDAIDILLDGVKKSGARVEGMEVNVVGGANVLGEGSISVEIVDSVLDYLKKLGIEPKNKKIGGSERRSVSLDIESGKIFYSEGDNITEEL